MAGQLIPAPALAPPALDRLTPAQRGRVWLELLATGEKLVLAGLRRELGPDAELRQAYQEWYRQRMEEHDRVLEDMLRRLNRGGRRRAS
jgi:hypothetical protein